MTYKQGTYVEGNGELREQDKELFIKHRGCNQRTNVVDMETNWGTIENTLWNLIGNTRGNKTHKPQKNFKFLSFLKRPI
jgi:hypothetical protein